MPGRPTRKARATLLVIGIAAICAIVVGIGLHSFSKREQPNQPAVRSSQTEVLKTPEPPTSDYAGGQSCRRCHESIWETYQSNSMSRSMEKIGDERPLEDFDRTSTFDVSTPLGTISYRVENSPQGQFHCETLSDKRQQSLYEQQVKIDFAVGSGHEGRSYLHVQNDSMYVSPITWYSQAGNWALTPSYEPGSNVRFERKVTLGCIMCHTDGVDVDRDEPNQISVSSIRHLAISCERCHGPGAGHIAFHDSRSGLNSTNLAHDPIVNPSKLDRARRESVCWQCHYDAEERVLRYGRIDSDFRPGMMFDEIWVPFMRIETSNRELPSQPVNHIEQIQTSQCFRRSEGRLGCSSCHDAHFVPARKDVGLFYRQKCLKCHAENDCSSPIEDRRTTSESDSCISCHMASREMERLPHTSQTDHRILRRPQKDAKPALDIEVKIHHDSVKNLLQIEQDRVWGIYLAREAERKRDIKLVHQSEQLLTSVLPHVVDDAEVLERLGFCEAVMGRAPSAKSHFAAILKRYPRDERALGQMSDVLIGMNDLSGAKATLIRYLAMNPFHAKFQFQLAVVQMRLGDTDAAIVNANEALRINPSFAPAHRILAEIYQKKGKAEEARHHLTLSQSLEPRK